MSKKKNYKTFPKPITVARAFAKNGWQIESIAGHYGIAVWHVELLLAKHILKTNGWEL